MRAKGCFMLLKTDSLWLGSIGSTQLSDNKVPKVAAGPVYEEVGLVTAQRTQDIQVVSNEAYGQVRKLT